MSVFWQIVTFLFVAAALLWAAYAIIRPFTHTHYRRRTEYHPPWLEDFRDGPARRS
jgi:hypothetical protein